jgi:flagellar biosynthetic protein FliR
LSQEAQDFVLSGFLIFCRIGMCLVILPAFSSPRIPVMTRVFLAGSISLALAPLIFDMVRGAIQNRSDTEKIGFVFSELVIGGTIGGLARIFFSAIESAAQAISSLAGLTGVFNQEVASDETGTPLTSLMSLSAATLILASDLHLQMFNGLLNSYFTFPPETPLENVVDLTRILQVFTASFYILLQICAPFVLFALIFNLALGLLNKLVPNIPVYFIASPFTAAGGLALMHILIKPTLTLFMASFAGWLAWSSK